MCTFGSRPRSWAWICASASGRNPVEVGRMRTKALARANASAIAHTPTGLVFDFRLDSGAPAPTAVLRRLHQFGRLLDGFHQFVQVVNLAGDHVFLEPAPVVRVDAVFEE